MKSSRAKVKNSSLVLEPFARPSRHLGRGPMVAVRRLLHQSQSRVGLHHTVIISPPRGHPHDCLFRASWPRTMVASAGTCPLAELSLFFLGSKAACHSPGAIRQGREEKRKKSKTNHGTGCSSRMLQWPERSCAGMSKSNLSLLKSCWVSLLSGCLSSPRVFLPLCVSCWLICSALLMQYHFDAALGGTFTACICVCTCICICKHSLAMALIFPCSLAVT
ncbi:hypothetical protein GGI42DRAFT_138384 [Trichoderma sp. SZMC 28013]